MSRVIRPNEVERILGVSKSTINRLERTGKLPKRVRIGPRIVGWYEHDIIDFLERIGSPPLPLVERDTNKDQL